MTPLRQRMIEDLRLRGYAERTVEAYTQAVAQLARFFDQSPDQLTEEQVRDYLVHLATVKKVARSTHTIALCSIKFFYEQTIERQWTVLDVARPKKEKKLPVVLSRDEVWKILDSVRNPIYRICLLTIYSCGLRLMEGAHLQVPNVDGARKILHVTGKGAKDRCVPLPDATLELLRKHWLTHRQPLCLFPATRQPTQPGSEAAVRPISRDSVQRAFKQAVKQSGVHKRVHVHTSFLRHPSPRSRRPTPADPGQPTGRVGMSRGTGWSVSTSRRGEGWGGRMANRAGWGEGIPTPSASPL